MPPSAAPSFTRRALGYASEGAPFAVQRRGTETFVTVSAGKAWQIYNCDKLRLVMVGPQFGDALDIRALAAKGDLTFAAVGRDVAVCRRSHRLCTFEGHAESITHSSFSAATSSASAPAGASSRGTSKDFMDYLDGKRSAASRDAGLQGVASRRRPGRLRRRRIRLGRLEIFLRPALSATPRVRAPARLPPHGGVPPGHVPEQDLPRRRRSPVLFLNVKTGSVIHVFEPDAMGNRSGASVTCLENSPALDTVAVGLSDGRAVGTTRRSSPPRLSTLATTWSENRCVRAPSAPVRANPCSRGGRFRHGVRVVVREASASNARHGRARRRGDVGKHFFSGSPILMTMGG